VRWVWVGVGSIVYWFCALWGLLAVAMVHGDCWATINDTEIGPCVNEKRTLVIVFVVLAAMLYGWLIWRIARRR